jgi:N-terminal domain of (some) glycogen debranching enzymes
VVSRDCRTAGGMRERVMVTNHGLSVTPVLLELFCDVDFADLFEVKESRVRRRGRHDDRVDLGALVFTHSLGDVRREVFVSATGDPHVCGRYSWPHCPVDW